MEEIKFVEYKINTPVVVTEWHNMKQARPWMLANLKIYLPISRQELLTLPERVSRSLVYMFYRSLFVLLSSLFWSLCCLFFFDLRILITFGIFRLFLW